MRCSWGLSLEQGRRQEELAGAKQGRPTGTAQAAEAVVQGTRWQLALVQELEVARRLAHSLEAGAEAEPAARQERPLGLSLEGQLEGQLGLPLGELLEGPLEVLLAGPLAEPSVEQREQAQAEAWEAVAMAQLQSWNCPLATTEDQ